MMEHQTVDWEAEYKTTMQSVNQHLINFAKYGQCSKGAKRSDTGLLEAKDLAQKVFVESIGQLGHRRDEFEVSPNLPSSQHAHLSWSFADHAMPEKVQAFYSTPRCAESHLRSAPGGG